MIRKIKGLALASLALAAFATVAHASEFHATTGSSISIFGERTAQHTPFKYQISIGSMQCNQSLVEGTVQGSGQTQTTFQELTLTPTHTNCTAFGLASTWDMNGCKYTITNKLFNGTTTAQRGTLDITGCTAGKGIEITAAGGCVVTFPEQHNLSDVGFQNNAGAGGNPHDVTMQLTVQGITYETHGACPNSPQPTVLNHNGQWEGGVTLRARLDQGSVTATHNNHQYQKLLQTGQLVGLEVT